jgi:PKHD-type hydroxylase
MVDRGVKVSNTLGEILVLESLISRELCEALLNDFKEKTPRPRSYQGIVDTSQRDCAFIEVSPELVDQVNSIIYPAIHKKFAKVPIPIFSQRYVIYRYLKGAGFIAHHDEVTEIEQERARTNGQPVIGGDLTTVVFLNSPEEYAGGALYFESPVKLSVRPPQGSVVVFPATKEYLHGVSEITAGERFTLLARQNLSS